MGHVSCSSFTASTQEMHSIAGGKAATLAKLYQKGYPVPDGFIVFPPAFSNDQLLPQAWRDIRRELERLRNTNGFTGAVAVRSSAASEDSAKASFAGEFDTQLNVSTDDLVKEAIETVYLSRKNKRVETYSQAKGINSDHVVSVIVQNMVPSEISGVLFTADPISGNPSCMIGNFIDGLGDRLVSGKVDGQIFYIKRPRGEYEGPKEFEPFSRALNDMAIQLERELALPQDIEWAIAGSRLYLLQSRPITTPLPGNPAADERNDSLKGNFLWSNVNFGEAIPDVMTPFTASALEQGPVAKIVKFKDYSAYGTICGRPYLNISVFASIFHALGKNNRQIIELLDSMALSLPKGLEIPLIASSKTILFSIVPQMILLEWRQRRSMRTLPALLAGNEAWCSEMRRVIEQAQTKEELRFLWEYKLKKHLHQIWFGLLASANHYSGYTTSLRRELIADVGPDTADALISGMSSESKLLASLGPLVGLSKVSRGEMCGKEYLKQYGHRSPNEIELSSPRPIEEPGWLDKQLADYRQASPDAEELLSAQRNRFQSAWEHFRKDFPHKEKLIEKRIGEVAKRARLREEVRSEYVRVFEIWRFWALRAGVVAGVGQDVFFLTLDEVIGLLNGGTDTLGHISGRKEAYARYKRLPPYPTVIKGPFDPFQWASDPNRRYDYFDAQAQTAVVPASAITGVAGSAGRAEGVVRCLSNPEEGDQLQAGEILVTSQINIGWTLVFPKTAAIVTDVGAPLSHAAIVARELGIPAVVGCGNATMLLKTGDRVKVDGSRGIVEILS